MIANVVFRLCASGLTVLLGYQVYELTRSPFSLGLLGLFEAIPGVTLILFGGDFADRHSRHRIVVVTMELMALLAAVLAIISSKGNASTLSRRRYVHSNHRPSSAWRRRYCRCIRRYAAYQFWHRPAAWRMLQAQ
jgi:hypothetical protein